MQIAMAVAGVTLIAVANYDALVTTVAVGSGIRPLTSRLAQVLRSILRRAPRLLPAGGPLITLSTIAVWILLLWAGYSLIFSAAPGAVTSSRSGAPAAGVSRVYYAGYTLFTLGNGGYQPAVGSWELVTNIATLNGLFVVTLAITFLVPVLSAVVERRQHASFISALGDTAEDVVVSAWNGHDFAFLQQQLPTVAQQILLTAQRHLAYPVLHDFRSGEPHAASERSLALLDDVLTLLEHGVDPSVRLDTPTATVTRFAIDEAVRLMPEADTKATPALPDLRILADAGIPTRPAREFAARADELAARRSHLAALVEAAAWRWPNRASDTA